MGSERTCTCANNHATALAAAAPPFMVLRPHDILALRAGASAQDVLNFIGASGQTSSNS